MALFCWDVAQHGCADHHESNFGLCAPRTSESPDEAGLR